MKKKYKIILFGIIATFSAIFGMLSHILFQKTFIQILVFSITAIVVALSWWEIIKIQFKLRSVRKE